MTHLICRASHHLEREEPRQPTGLTFSSVPKLLKLAWRKRAFLTKILPDCKSSQKRRLLLHQKEVFTFSDGHCFNYLLLEHLLSSSNAFLIDYWSEFIVGYNILQCKYDSIFEMLSTEFRSYCLIWAFKSVRVFVAFSISLHLFKMTSLI